MRFFNNFKIAFIAILDKIFFSLFIIFQLTASMYLIYENISINKTLTNDISHMESLFDTNNIFAINNIDELETLINLKFKEDNIIERQIKFEDFLANSKDFTRLISNNRPIAFKNFNNMTNFIASNTANESLTSPDFSMLLALNGNYNFYKNYNFEILEGRYFNVKDFESTDVSPIILGYNYKDIFKLNDTIDFYDPTLEKTKKIKVIGFLQKNIHMYQSTFAPESLYSLDNYILTPFYEFSLPNENHEFYDSYVRNKYFDIYLNTTLVSNKSADELNKLFQEQAQELNLYNSNIQSGNELINVYRDINNTNKQFLLLIFSIVLIFTVLNVTTTLLEFINKNRKNFAVNLMCGATFTDLLQRIFLELAILMTLSFGLFVSIKLILGINTSLIAIDLSVLIVTGLISIFLVFILTIIPALAIKKISLNKILKGD